MGSIKSMNVAIIVWGKRRIVWNRRLLSRYENDGLTNSQIATSFTNVSDRRRKYIAAALCELSRAERASTLKREERR